jgi:hypothetical protein
VQIASPPRDLDLDVCVEVWPINHFPDQEVNNASNALVMEHSRAFPTERILMQVTTHTHTHTHTHARTHTNKQTGKLRLTSAAILLRTV